MDKELRDIKDNMEWIKEAQRLQETRLTQMAGSMREIAGWNATPEDPQGLCGINCQLAQLNDTMLEMKELALLFLREIALPLLKERNVQTDGNTENMLSRQ